MNNEVLGLQRVTDRKNKRSNSVDVEFENSP